jgi:hypothetical protein
MFCNFFCYANVLVFYVLGLVSCVVTNEQFFESPKVGLAQ